MTPLTTACSELSRGCPVPVPPPPSAARTARPDAPTQREKPVGLIVLVRVARIPASSLPWRNGVRTGMQRDGWERRVHGANRWPPVVDRVSRYTGIVSPARVSMCFMSAARGLHDKHPVHLDLKNRPKRTFSSEISYGDRGQWWRNKRGGRRANSSSDS